MDWLSGESGPATMPSSHGRSRPNADTHARKSATVFSEGIRTSFESSAISSSVRGWVHRTVLSFAGQRRAPGQIFSPFPHSSQRRHRGVHPPSIFSIEDHGHTVTTDRQFVAFDGGWHFSSGKRQVILHIEVLPLPLQSLRGGWGRRGSRRNCKELGRRHIFKNGLVI